MHRAFAVWLLGKPYRTWVAAALLGLSSLVGMSLFVIPAGAVSVLSTLARDTRTGFQVLIAGIVSATALLLGSGQPLVTALGWVGLVFIAPYGLAAIAQRTGSLRVCFQTAILTSALVLVAIYVGMDDPVARWQVFANEWNRVFASQLTQMGVDFDAKAVAALFARTNWGTIVTEGLLTALSALFLGCWWQSLAQAPGAFGKEFQQIGLGKGLGAAAVGVVLAVFALDKFESSVPLLSALLWVATIGLAIQGLAAAHRFKASGRMGGGWLVAIYVLLIFAAPIVVTLLAGWGVADNWRRRE